MDFFKSLKDKLKDESISIAFPESEDVRILEACTILDQTSEINPILIGEEEKIKNRLKELGLGLGNIEIIDPKTYAGKEDMKDSFLERRKGKVTEEDGERLLQDHNYFATMLVYMEKVDALVSGAVGTTGDTVRPALQIIKTRPGVSRISGAMLMTSPEGDKYIFADIAINVNLEAGELAEVAIESAKTAKIFNIEPRVAMLSFSTKGSASSPEQEKVAQATKIAQEKAPNLDIDGELQFDAAIDEKTGKSKAPNSNVAGKANVFIFPDLESGNIGYKIAQRLGGYAATGPILQGLAKPIADLSRGCSVDDVVRLSYITAIQVLEDKQQ